MNELVLDGENHPLRRAEIHTVRTAGFEGILHHSGEVREAGGMRRSISKPWWSHTER